MELAREIYVLTSKFPKSELYGIVSQMRRAVISIVSNIAEGSGRGSRKEYKHFYGISYGSALELETQVLLAKSLQLATESDFAVAEGLLVEVLKMLNSITRKLSVSQTSS